MEEIKTIVAPASMVTSFSPNSVQAEQVATVITCVGKLAETLSKIPIEVYRTSGQGKVKAKDHPLYRTVHYRFNDFMTSKRAISALETYRNFQGNAFALIKRREPDAAVIGLEVISPNRIEDLKIRNGILMYDIEFEKETRSISSENVLHFKGLSLNGYWGLTPIEVLRYNWEVVGKAGQLMTSFLDNNASTAKAIKSTTGVAASKQMSEAIAQFAENYAGAANAGKLIKLPPNTELQDVSMRLADAELLNTVKFNARQIYALYGVPYTLEDPKYSTVEQLLLDFYANTMSVIASIYRDEFEFKLLTEEERDAGVSIEFNDKALLMTDATTRATVLKNHLEMGAITPNQICEIEGYPTYPEGNKHYLPANNLQPVEGGPQTTQSNEQE
jgi:HK97 family phage portal protein